MEENEIREKTIEEIEQKETERNSDREKEEQTETRKKELEQLAGEIRTLILKKRCC